MSLEDQGERLSRDECVMLVIDIIQGGTKTTAAEFGHMMHLFSGHPDRWRLLEEHPELARQATEEVLRFEPIAPFDPRMMDREREFKGTGFFRPDRSFCLYRYGELGI